MSSVKKNSTLYQVRVQYYLLGTHLVMHLVQQKKGIFDLIGGRLLSTV